MKKDLPQGEKRAKTRVAWRVLLYTLLAFLSITLPTIIKLTDILFLGDYLFAYSLLNLFTYFTSLSLLIITVLELRRLKNKTFLEVLSVVLPVFVAFFFLLIISEQFYELSDFHFYIRGAEAVLTENSLYSINYEYPPLVAQVLAGMYKLVDGCISNLGLDASVLYESIALDMVFKNQIVDYQKYLQDPVWSWLYYLFICGQFFQVLLAFFLFYKLSLNFGIKKISALLLTTVLFTINYPLFISVCSNQMNLLVFTLILLSLCAVKGRRFFAGLALALAINIKLYPIMMLFTWSAIRRWVLVVGIIVGILFLLLLQTNWGTDWSYVQEYFLHVFGPSADPPMSFTFYDGSIKGLVMRTLDKIYSLRGITMELNDMESVVYIVTLLFVISIIAWFVVRFIRRERIYKKYRDTEMNFSGDFNNMYRFLGHTMDTLALNLIISPLIFDYHYIFVMPLLLWAITIFHTKRLWMIGLGALLIYAPPLLYVFPLYYHRLAGLLLLLMVTSPKAVADDIMKGGNQFLLS